jgi:alpha-L-fucosidase
MIHYSKGKTMKKRILTLIMAATTLNMVASGFPPPEPYGPVPSTTQQAWHDLEYGMFCHFGINTFHNLEWSDGTKPPESFLPTDFSAEQWVAVVKEVGMKYLVVTAKHHDGFCLYPTAHTTYSVTSSIWRDGQGDVVREVANACHGAGIMFGFYLSPWDRHEPKYTDSQAYDGHFKNQLKELLTGYGPVGEVWFDGAGSQGHVYDWQGYYSLIRELQPQALIAICGPDIRWIGNEDGLAPETLWNVHEQSGKPSWYPSECDVPIRGSHWFYHTEDEASLRSIDDLLEIYYRSVGRGANLLLNVAPDRRGRLPEVDVARLRELKQVISTTFAHNLLSLPTDASNNPSVKLLPSNVRGNDPHFDATRLVDCQPDTYWATDDGVTSATLEIQFDKPHRFNRSMLQEYLHLGQRIESHQLQRWDGREWKNIVTGTTIGQKRLERFDPVITDKVRLIITRALASPCLRSFGLYFYQS